MRYSTQYLQFIAAFPNISLNYFITNGEWELQSTELIIRNFSTGGDSALSCIQMKFSLKRRPAFLILNIILPVVFLSFLNILVFVIPVESGEKIGYGITVLLALSVFMSIVSGMLPRSSLNMPNVTIYLFFLLFLSMLTVIDSIIIVYLHHKEGEETTHQKVKSQFRGLLSNVTKIRNVVSAFEAPETDSKQDSARKVLSLFGSNASLSDSMQPSCDEKGNKRATEMKQGELPKVNKYKLIGKHIDLVSFVIFLLLWLAATLGFMLDMALS
ncbi:unnamed protein product [Lymnaea stagnalis]|uniref:Neurotransmitter-gated ion-channel transmembrane domain-containing protein n=1 Tax=Lymnaea stagnalis TaxID=6523 RepID=A0AAV2HNF3_LYMST